MLSNNVKRYFMVIDFIDLYGINSLKVTCVVSVDPWINYYIW